MRGPQVLCPGQAAAGRDRSRPHCRGSETRTRQTKPICPLQGKLEARISKYKTSSKPECPNAKRTQSLRLLAPNKANLAAPVSSVKLGDPSVGSSNFTRQTSRFPLRAERLCLGASNKPNFVCSVPVRAYLITPYGVTTNAGKEGDVAA